DEHVYWQGGAVKDIQTSERYWALHYHSLAELLALAAGGLGIAFAFLLYYARVFNAEEAREQFPALHSFLGYKWYFDELYSAVLVRPALVAAYWCRAFDTYVIDGFVNLLGRVTVWVSKTEGWIDLGLVDGLVNVFADAVYAAAAR